MISTSRGDPRNGPPIPASYVQRILQAERDYYDCMARFGHASAEAHVARLFWRHLRSRALRGHPPSP